MGLLDNYRAKREAKRKRDNARYVNERQNTYGNGLDPLSTGLLYTSVASSNTHSEHDSDLSDQSDDTARDDTLDSADNDAVDSYESESDRYNPADTGSDYGHDYSAPTYDFSSPSESYSSSSSSYDSGSSSSYDSGSSSSYDSGSSSSFDSGSSY